MAKLLFKYEFVGFAASILSSISMLPQVWSVAQTGEVDNISMAWIFLTILASCLWFFFGLANNIRPTIISSAVILLSGLILFHLKYKNQKEKPNENFLIRTKNKFTPLYLSTI